MIDRARTRAVILRHNSPRLINDHSARTRTVILTRYCQFDSRRRIVRLHRPRAATPGGLASFGHIS
nr:hypothetical protein fc147 [uncultured bacterium]